MSETNNNPEPETKTDNDEEETANKKQRVMTNVEQAPDSDWPEAWYMEEGETVDQKAPNRQEPNKAATVADLRKIGIQYWKMDAETYSYPVKAVPWDPKDAVDPKLSALRDDREWTS
jgi:1,2-dihydroxy-3-keto-5-methylthiopentene dioxygenase